MLLLVKLHFYTAIETGSFEKSKKKSGLFNILGRKKAGEKSDHGVKV